MDPITMGIGSLLTGGVGSMLGSKSSRWSGTKPHMQRFETLNKYQKKLLKNVTKHPEVQLQESQYNPSYQAGNKYIQDILSQNPEMMQQFEAPYMRQFKEQIVPDLAQRFASGGALSSSAFNQSMGQAASSLSERLAAMRANLGMNASSQALAYSQVPFQEQMANQNLNLNRMGLALGTPAFGQAVIPGTEGAGTSFMGNLMSGGMNMAAGGFMNRPQAQSNPVGTVSNWASNPTASPFRMTAGQTQQPFSFPGQM